MAPSEVPMVQEWKSSHWGDSTSDNDSIVLPCEHRNEILSLLYVQEHLQILTKKCISSHMCKLWT